MSSIGFVTESKVIQQPEEFLDHRLLGFSQNRATATTWNSHKLPEAVENIFVGHSIFLSIKELLSSRLVPHIS